MQGSTPSKLKEWSEACFSTAITAAGVLSKLAGAKLSNQGVATIEVAEALMNAGGSFLL